MSQNSPLSEKQALERLQSISARASELNEKIISLKALKKRNEQELESAEKRAIDQFGTSDLDQLRTLYREKITKQTNEILEYEQEVERIFALVTQVESELQEIESKYAQ